MAPSKKCVTVPGVTVIGQMQNNENHNKMVFTTNTQAECRVYFFDVKQSREGARYVCITEKRGVSRNNVLVFEEHLDGFVRAMLEAVEQCKTNPARAA